MKDTQLKNIVEAALMAADTALEYRSFIAIV